jgi:hypothetical protein
VPNFEHKAMFPNWETKRGGSGEVAAPKPKSAKDREKGTPEWRRRRMAELRRELEARIARDKARR